MIAVDLSSLSLKGAMRRVGQGSGRRLVPYSRRFKLTEPHRRHAAWRHSHRGGGEGAQMGRGEGAGGGVGAGGEGWRGVRGKDMHALYFKF